MRRQTSHLFSCPLVESFAGQTADTRTRDRQIDREKERCKGGNAEKVNRKQARGRKTRLCWRGAERIDERREIEGLAGTGWVIVFALEREKRIKAVG